jgi:LPS-assembly lipoprotein
MLSLEVVRVRAFARRIRNAAAIAGLVGLTTLGGCGWQPLYGPTASGAQLEEVMRTVDISIIPGRVGQRIRNELIFKTTGGGDPNVPQFRLDIAVRESVLNTLVDSTGDPKGQIYQLYSQFKLVRLTDNQVVLEGNNNARAAYDKADSVFADIRAKRDAEDRAARTISEAIRTRMAAYFSANA